MRRATVSRPAVTMSGTDSFFFNTMVRGPGQKRSARRCTDGGISSVQLDDLVKEDDMNNKVDRKKVVSLLRNPRYRLRIERVGAETVHSLGRKGDDPSCFENIGGSRQIVFRRLKYIHCVSLNMGTS